MDEHAHLVTSNPLFQPRVTSAIDRLTALTEGTTDRETAVRAGIDAGAVRRPCPCACPLRGCLRLRLSVAWRPPVAATR
jgi:hypothetical protein